MPYDVKILRNEKITVPAGTFDTVVIESTGFFSTVTYWLISNQPAIYAKTEEINKKKKITKTLLKIELKKPSEQAKP